MKKLDKPPCIVNVGVGHWYPRGQDRLKASIDQWGTDVPTKFLPWAGVYPEGSPTHQEVPYAFKAHAINAVRNLGYEQVLWLDCSMWLQGNWGEFWDLLSTRGMLAWQCDAGPVGTWCCDAALPKLGVTREQAMEIPMASGGCVAWDFRHLKTRKVWDYYWEQARTGSFIGPWDTRGEFVSHDERVRGHRHDMPALSIGMQRAGIELLQEPYLFGYPYRPNPHGYRHIIACCGL